MKKLLIMAVFLVSGHVSAAGTAITNTMPGAASKAAPAVHTSALGGRVDLKLTQPVMNKKSALSRMVRTVVYDPLSSIRVDMRENMSSLIVLPEGEVALSHILSDNEGFTVDHQNKTAVLITPNHVGVDSTFFILSSSGAIYSFYLETFPVDGHRVNDSVTYITLPPVRGSVEVVTIDQAGNDEVEQKEDQPPAVKGEEVDDHDYLLTPNAPGRDDMSFSFNAVTEHGDLIPKQIWSDGTFTFFKFADDLQSLKTVPVIYLVVDGLDHPVQSEIKDGVYIAKTVGDRWTIWAGSAHACIFKADAK